MKTDQFPSQETLDTVNSLLPGASPIGAYCLGVVCALAWKTGAQPPKTVLELAVKCDSVNAAIDLYSTVGSLLT